MRTLKLNPELNPKLNPELKLKLKLFLLLLLNNSACSVYMSAMHNSSITSDVYKKMDDVSKCRCKAECAVETTCVAVSYDAGARQCLLGGGEEEGVSTQGTPNATTYFKFRRNEQGDASEPTTTTKPTTTIEPTTTTAPPTKTEPATTTVPTTTTEPATTTEPTTTTAPATTTTGGLPIIFATAAFTKDGKVANQKNVCAAENGVPITINTKEIRAAATDVTITNGRSAFGGPKYVWLVARDQNGDSNIQWADGSNVVDNVTFVAADIEKKSAGPSTFLRDDSKIEHSAESTYNDYPVLCVRS